VRLLPLCLAVVLVASPAAAQSRVLGGRCKESCTRLLTDPRLRAVLCGRCLTDASGDRGVWAVALKDESPRQEQLDDILKDDDWQVRWGAVRADATLRGRSEIKQLAMWIVDGKDPLLGCMTAVHLAGSRKQTLPVLLQPGGTMGPSAAAVCVQKKEDVKKALEVQLYSTDAVTRREALLHLAFFLDVPAARVVLNAMASRGPETDESSAQLLVEDAEADGPAAGAALLKAATRTDAARVDRLLAVWSKTLDVQRPRLKSAELTERKEAISVLSVLGPLGAHELEGLLEDPDPVIRLAAARALARGEGRTLAGEAKAMLDPANKVPHAVRARWAEVLGRGTADECESTLRAAAQEPKLDETVRAAALTALGSCAQAKALPEIKEALAGKSLKLKVAAVDALADIARVPEATGLVEQALKASEPELLAAAVRAAGAQHLTAHLPEARALLEHSHPEVRLAAVRAVVLLGDGHSAVVLGKVLAKDASPDVREAAAKALGEIGGPEAMGPLTHASERDASPRVKYVAAQSLRKLGFTK
jgi:HEAT repeat protein